MKTTRRIVASILALLASAVALAGKPLAGPKGGRILTTEAPHAEFFVQADRTILLSFYDEDLKPVTPGGRTATATVEAKAGRTRLEFIEQGSALVSTSPLPEGDGYTVVVQLREKSTARPRNFRVTFHDEPCPECKRAEYACICDDAGDEKEHKH